MILWTIRLATLCYAFALLQWIRRRDARPAWTAGCVLYLAHVAAAFHYAYHWSHSMAVHETARQTAALFGVAWGGGIWFNYLFTVVWTADVLWWHWAPIQWSRRPAWIGRAVHGYMAWMFVNGAIVFPQGPSRWVAAALALLLLVLWGKRSIARPA